MGNKIEIKKQRIIEKIERINLLYLSISNGYKCEVHTTGNRKFSLLFEIPKESTRIGADILADGSVERVVAML